MIITNHREKLINAIIYFTKKTKYCGKTKLLKLLYFLDFSHFRESGRSVTGLDYFAWDKGPVPKDLFEELSGDMKPDLKNAIKIVQIENFQKITPRKKFDDKYFTNREIRLLKHWSFIFKEAKSDDMVNVTHLSNKPWEKTLKEKGEYQKIDYLLSIDNGENSLTINEAINRMEEISEMNKIFGVA